MFWYVSHILKYVFMIMACNYQTPYRVKRCNKKTNQIYSYRCSQYVLWKIAVLTNLQTNETWKIALNIEKNLKNS